ncbi:MAG: 30S ribosomal protein S20 [Erysipelotrichaceae bacterium]
MPQIKSQKKRALTNLKRSAAVTSEKSALKTAIKTVLKAVELKDADAAKTALDFVNSKLDKAVTGGIHHKNYASRQKSRLAKIVASV